ncbi:MAG: glycosyltransferase [Lachnospira eligens]
MKVSVIIPSLNPDNKLVAVVDALLEEGFKDIIIVNDGSDEEHMAPFNEVAAYSNVQFLHMKLTREKEEA